MFTLPFTDPIPIFLTVLLVILLATVLNRIHIPQMIGLIVAGVILGPFGFGVLDNDQSFLLFGKVGILYIMFQVGLDVDLATFKLQKRQGILFGIYTLCLPLAVALLGGHYLLGMNLLQSLLFSAMMTCHTLLAYPVVGKMGITENRAINIVITGTIIAVTISLLMIAVVVGSTGSVHNSAPTWLIITTKVVAIILFCIFVFLILPKISEAFFKQFSDGISQYIYVLAAVFAASLIAEATGLEGILGAFFAGLVLNRYIKPTSALMNRITFVGNAIFIPFFLISIGMQINISAFIHGHESILTAVIMSIIAISTKWGAAKITQITAHLTHHEGNLIFGLTSGKAAASLAAVMIGREAGLFDENILNGTIIMILVTVLVSSAVTDRAARKIASQKIRNTNTDNEIGVERVMISIGNPQTMQSLIELGCLVKRREIKDNLYALKIIRSEDDRFDGERDLLKAEIIAAETDTPLKRIIKNDINIANCMTETAKEYDISDIIVGIHQKANLIDTFLGSTINSLIENSAERNFMVFGARNILEEMRRIIVHVPLRAEKELGFRIWLDRIRNLAVQSKMQLIFHSTGSTLQTLRQLSDIFKGTAVEFWDQDHRLENELTDQDLLTVVMARRNTISYRNEMDRVPQFLSQHGEFSFLIIYPRQSTEDRQRWSKYNPLKLNN